MQAGFARVDITPPLGTPMAGYGSPRERPALRINDPLYVRALALEDGGREAVVLSFDFCFIGREQCDRLCGVLGRRFGLLPHQLLMAATHNHAAPAVDTYLDMLHDTPPRDYLNELTAGVVHAVDEARRARRPVRVRAAAGKTTLPMNRRQRQGDRIVNGPNPGGPVHDALPVCLLEDEAGKPVCLLFSIATHPVCMNKQDLSADYPGVACDLLDQLLGATCSLFLQGAAGDSRPRTLSAGQTWNWNCGWAEAQATGTILADEVKAVLPTLTPRTPRLASAVIETHWPLQPPMTAEQYRAMAASNDDGKFDPLVKRASPKARWAEHQVRLLERGTIARDASILMHGVRLADDVRLVAIEGEPLCEHGIAIEAAYPQGVTFALGYAWGEGMYLVTSAHLDEGGYEPESYWEYNHPAPLAKGVEAVRDAGVAELKRLGIE